MTRHGHVTELPEPPISQLLFADTRFALIWLFLRVYVGWQWLDAGWGKVHNADWVGPKAGKIVAGFTMAALEKAGGAHPDVSDWYAAWLGNVVLTNASLFSHIVAFGEVFVGIALILGLFTGIAAFFGGFMNMNYLFAGTVSVNPLLFLIQLFLILAWLVAGWIGLDRFALPFLGVPWKPGDFFVHKTPPTPKRAKK